MQKPDIAENPQERLWSWLGGLMDGEASFSITHKFTKGKKYHYPDISIVNTNPVIIDKCARIIKTITGLHIETKIPGTPGNAIRKLLTWRIRILGFKRCAKLLPTLIPYLVGKREEAELLLEFVKTKRKDLSMREEMKKEITALKNPQRLYAGQYKVLKIKSDLTGDCEQT